MKQYYRLALLFLWLFALTAPSLLTVLNPDKPVIITNLNEEEPQEIVKKLQNEEKIVTQNYFNLFILPQDQKTELSQMDQFVCLDCTLDILLPPPEHTS